MLPYNTQLPTYRILNPYPELKPGVLMLWNHEVTFAQMTLPNQVRMSVTDNALILVKEVPAMGHNGFGAKKPSLQPHDN